MHIEVLSVILLLINYDFPYCLLFDEEGKYYKLSNVFETEYTKKLTSAPNK